MTSHDTRRQSVPCRTGVTAMGKLMGAPLGLRGSALATRGSARSSGMERPPRRSNAPLGQSGTPLSPPFVILRVFCGKRCSTPHRAGYHYGLKDSRAAKDSGAGGQSAGGLWGVGVLVGIDGVCPRMCAELLRICAELGLGAPRGEGGGRACNTQAGRPRSSCPAAIRDHWCDSRTGGCLDAELGLGAAGLLSPVRPRAAVGLQTGWDRGGGAASGR
jgi:hypothetical protein